MVAQLACGGVMPPTDSPVTETSIEQAAAVVRDTASREPDFQLVEGGVSVEAYEWSWRDRIVVEPMPGAAPMVAGSNIVLEAPRLVRERVLVGPTRRYIAFRELAGVAVRRWAIGAGLELTLEGVAEPIYVEMNDALTAQRLADALDLLRRASQEKTKAEKGPLPAPAGE